MGGIKIHMDAYRSLKMLSVGNHGKFLVWAIREMLSMGNYGKCIVGAIIENA